jgi:hypothetical protein
MYKQTKAITGKLVSFMLYINFKRYSPTNHYAAREANKYTHIHMEWTNIKIINKNVLIYHTNRNSFCFPLTASAV